MRRSALASLAALVAALTAINLFSSANMSRQATPTTFGTMPAGYGAVFNLLAELHLPVSRSYAPVEELPASSTVWWIEPAGVCKADAAEAASARSEANPEPPEEIWPLDHWVADGGTAVIFLGTDACSRIGSISLPARTSAGGEDGESNTAASPGSGSVPLSGALVPLPLWMPAGLRTFAAAPDWRVAAALDGSPFVIERRLGEGHIAVVADARFLRNRWLASGDAAPFAVDLVRQYGVPRFDERTHGMRLETSALRYLLTSPALGVFIGLAALGALFAWRGATLPPSDRSASEAAPPTFSAFVDSVARLYARSGDHQRILECYRELTAERLRRALGLPPESALAVVAERARSRRSVSEAGVRLLLEGAAVGNESDLRREARRLDTLVAEVAA